MKNPITLVAHKYLFIYVLATSKLNKTQKRNISFQRPFPIWDLRP